MSAELQTEFPLLEAIDAVEDLRRLPRSRLDELARELREFLLQSVANTGGHLAAGLGTVELTIALHYVFNTPDDRLVWDVGHQTYPHKILTGRRQQMASLRQHGGLAGFPKRSESEFDSFGVGHSSTSISAALGMSLAAEQTGDDRHHVAVIGDGAMTAGLAFEALNHAGDSGANLLVILNDNDMSISPNVGGLSNHLTRLLSGKLYSTVREGGKKALELMPPVWELARRTEEHVKGMVAPGTLFEELGFNYFGPIDGHDLSALIPILENLREQQGPRFLHIVTQKGKGYSPAEKNPVQYHGVTKFDPDSGESLAKSGRLTPTYTDVFSDWICDMASANDRVVAITPAMREGSGLVEFSRRYPGRYFDVGIAEQHAVTLAAGMACDGLKPVVAIYSTFLQRAYDQLIHDVAIQNLDVTFAIDRAGLVGADGPTHTGAFDLSFLRCIPNLVLMTPSDENECRQMLYTACMHDGPAAVRYPRGQGPGSDIRQAFTLLEIGKSESRRQGQDVALLVFGNVHDEALKAAEELDASVINMRYVKPLDESAVLKAAKNHRLLVTIEENALAGGAGSAVNECLSANHVQTSVLNLGFPDEFVEVGDQQERMTAWGLDATGIIERIRQHPSMK